MTVTVEQLVDHAIGMNALAERVRSRGKCAAAQVAERAHLAAIEAVIIRLRRQRQPKSIEGIVG